MAAARRFEAEAPPDRELDERELDDFDRDEPDRDDALLRLRDALDERLPPEDPLPDDRLPPDRLPPDDRLLEERLLEPLDLLEPPLDLPLLRRCAI